MSEKVKDYFEGENKKFEDPIEKVKNYISDNAEKLSDETILKVVIDIVLDSFLEYTKQIKEQHYPKEIEDFIAWHLRNILISMVVSLYTTVTGDHKLAMKIASECVANGGSFYHKKGE